MEGGWIPVSRPFEIQSLGLLFFERFHWRNHGFARLVFGNYAAVKVGIRSRLARGSSHFWPALAPQVGQVLVRNI